jgi:thiazole synthase
MEDTYRIGDKTFASRLIVGSGKYPSFAVMREALAASGTEMVTVAIRRIDLNDDSKTGFWANFDREKYTILPNTAGCYDVKSAVTTAHLAREATGSDLIKVEVIGDESTLFPDNEGLLEACRILLGDGFTVLPYCTDDPVVCRKLEDLGCHAVMPLAAPIGSGLGIRNPYNLRIILEQCALPVIVDAGVGTASDAAVAMELGAGAVLMQSAIAGADDPVQMARAMRLAIQAGRLARRAGRIPMKLYATASSPLEGVAGV